MQQQQQQLSDGYCLFYRWVVKIICDQLLFHATKRVLTMVVMFCSIYFSLILDQQFIYRHESFTPMSKPSTSAILCHNSVTFKQRIIKSMILHVEHPVMNPNFIDPKSPESYKSLNGTVNLFNSL